MLPLIKILLVPNKANKIQRLFLITPAIVWGFFIGISTLVPSHNIPDTVFNAYDKIIHAVIFGLFTYLLYYGFRSETEKKQRLRFLKNTLTLLSIFYGGIIEIIQANYISGRSGDWMDFSADTVGCLIVFLLFDLGGKIRLPLKK